MRTGKGGGGGGVVPLSLCSDWGCGRGQESTKTSKTSPKDAKGCSNWLNPTCSEYRHPTGKRLHVKFKVQTKPGPREVNILWLPKQKIQCTDFCQTLLAFFRKKCQNTHDYQYHAWSSNICQYFSHLYSYYLNVVSAYKLPYYKTFSILWVCSKLHFIKLEAINKHLLNIYC